MGVVVDRQYDVCMKTFCFKCKKPDGTNVCRVSNCQMCQRNNFDPFPENAGESKCRAQTFNPTKAECLATGLSIITKKKWTTATNFLKVVKDTKMPFGCFIEKEGKGVKY